MLQPSSGIMMSFKASELDCLQFVGVVSSSFADRPCTCRARRRRAPQRARARCYNGACTSRCRLAGEPAATGPRISRRRTGSTSPRRPRFLPPPPPSTPADSESPGPLLRGVYEPPANRPRPAPINPPPPPSPRPGHGATMLCASAKNTR
jgi:hypothetical protein